MNEMITAPIYQKIAVDIAINIVSGKYYVGQTLYGRSVLAGHYGVSPETIRRAVYILKDVGILNTEKGSGIKIVSMEKAVAFVEQFQNINKIHEIEKSISDYMHQQKKAQIQLMQDVKELIDITERYKEQSPFTPFALHIAQGMNYVGSSSSELAFWQKTGATIIGVKRGKELILSPGPYTTFEDGDVLSCVGDEECFERGKRLFTEKGIN